MLSRRNVHSICVSKLKVIKLHIRGMGTIYGYSRIAISDHALAPIPRKYLK